MKVRTISISLILIFALLAVGCGEKRYYINYPYKHAVELRTVERVTYIDWCEPVWFWEPGVTVWWGWYWWYYDDPPARRTVERTHPLRRKPIPAESSAFRRESLKSRLPLRRKEE